MIVGHAIKAFISLGCSSPKTWKVRDTLSHLRICKRSFFEQRHSRVSHCSPWWVAQSRRSAGWRRPLNWPSHQGLEGCLCTYHRPESASHGRSTSASHQMALSCPLCAAQPLSASPLDLLLMCACCSVGPFIQRSGHQRAYALALEAPAVVGAHQRPIRWLYPALCAQVSLCQPSSAKHCVSGISDT